MPLLAKLRPFVQSGPNCRKAPWTIRSETPVRHTAPNSGSIRQVQQFYDMRSGLCCFHALGKPGALSGA